MPFASQRSSHHQTMKASASQKVLSSIQSGATKQFNFYPQLASNLDISVPPSENNGSVGQADQQYSAVGSSRQARFKDDSNLLSSTKTAD